MQIALSAKNKLVIVNGSYVAPLATSVLFPHWKCVNDMVITWILNTVSDDISNSMNYMDNIVDVWTELDDRFSIASGHKIYELQKNLLWHKRLGHAPSKVLSKISDISFSTLDLVCDICPLSKQCRLPFPISTSFSSNKFDLIHCDLWGPYRLFTCNVCKYFLTILDDYSRALWTVLLPTKQYASQALQDFCLHVSTQFQSCSVKCVRTDNGT